ncbi:MAG: peptidylprolyl isomerase [candidate division NC10 bacterium]
MMLKGLGLALGLVLTLCALAAPALAQSSPAEPKGAPPRGLVLDRVVASVNDEAITLSEVQEEGQPVIRKIFQDFVGPERERRVEEAQQRLMDDLIDRRMMYQVAKQEGLTPSPAEVQGAIDELKRNNNVTDEAQFRALLKAEGLTVEQIRRSIAERLAIGRVMIRQVRSSIILSEDELLKTYQENKQKFQREPSAEIEHILFPIDPGQGEAAARGRAEEALAKIRGGADFAQVGKEVASAPGRGQSDQLTVRRGELAPEIEAAAFGLSSGGVSEPIRTAGGFHLIKVLRIQAEPFIPFAEVWDQVREQLFQEKFEVKRKDWLAALRARSSIHVFVKDGEILRALGEAKGGEASDQKKP